MNTKQKVAEAFKKLKELGYFAEEDFWCCQSCAWNAMSDEEAEKAVFYHHQDNDAWDEDECELESDLYLAWSGNSEEICNVLKECGLQVKHDGSEGSRIIILKTI